MSFPTLSMGAMDNYKAQRVVDRRTICEVHRQLYDHCIVYLDDRPELRDKMAELIEEAYQMGIKMNNKLVEYKYNTYADAPPNLIADAQDLRTRRIAITSQQV